MNLAQGLLDTSVFIAHESGRGIDENLVPAACAMSVVTISELRAGVLAARSAVTRERRLATLEAVRSFDVLPIDDDVAQAWARLRIVLRDASARMGVNDSWIAATAIAHTLPIVTQDDDFDAARDLLHVIRV